MKGYKLDKTLYIFDATPATIPVSVDDVDIIYVQQELLAAYVNANQDAASKIKPYNYKLLAVNKLPWADYIDNDLVEKPDYHPEPEEPDLGTVYDFLGYEKEDSSEQTSYGTVTYNGIYEGTPETDLPTDGTYIWGTATITFTGASEPTTASVFIGKDSLSTIDTETRVQVFTLKADAPTQTESIGYVEIYTHEPQVDHQLTVVNNLPEGYTCEVAILSNVDEEPVPVEDTTNPISLYENDGVFVKVFNENSEVVNYYPDEILNGIQIDGIISDYDGAHENVEVMQHGNVYCSIEGEFNDEIPTSALSYSIANQRIATASLFGYGESFSMPPIPLTLTIQKP